MEVEEVIEIATKLSKMTVEQVRTLVLVSNSFRKCELQKQASKSKIKPAKAHSIKRITRKHWAKEEDDYLLSLMKGHTMRKAAVKYIKGSRKHFTAIGFNYNKRTLSAVIQRASVLNKKPYAADRLPSSSLGLAR